MANQSNGDETVGQVAEAAAPGFGHPYRRELLRQRLDEPIHLADVAREIANGRDEAEPKSVYVALYHRHAPKLADEGLVSFDPDQRTVSAAGEERTGSW